MQNPRERAAGEAIPVVTPPVEVREHGTECERRVGHAAGHHNLRARTQGLRDLLHQLRQQRRERLDQFDLGGVMEDIRRHHEHKAARGVSLKTIKLGGMRAVMAAGITVGLATDGPASHNSSDIFEEMKFAGLIHKTVAEDVEFLKIGEILEMSTAQGALAQVQRRTFIGAGRTPI